MTTGRKLFRVFLGALCVASAWMAYANVLSDDTAVRDQARATLNEAAGCDGDCRLEGLRGDRGMLKTQIAYDVAKQGRYVVVCRRGLVIAGDYECTVTEQPSRATTSAAP